MAGVIYNPATDDMFFAERGQGAYLNNHRLRVAARRELADALIACGIPPLGNAKEHPRFKAELAATLAVVGNLRRLGAAALDLAYVAAGRFDAYWERGTKSWDVAAGALLVREAGGFVSDADGRDAYLESGQHLRRQRSDSPRACSARLRARPLAPRKAVPEACRNEPDVSGGSARAARNHTATICVSGGRDLC